MHYRFFDVMVHPESRRYLSEDYGFCRLWEKIGGELDLRRCYSNLTHQGERYSIPATSSATLKSGAPLCRLVRPKGSA